MPRQPKLRSSCDGCGAAKLKCDRDQPACGRCHSLDLPCVYGVSRKRGKPPRDGPRLPNTPGTFSHSAEHPHTTSEDRDRNNDHCTDGYGYDGTFRDPGQGLDSHPGMTVQAPDTTFNELFWPLLPNFTSMEFNDALFSDMGSGPTPALQLATPESESLATPAAQTDAPQTQVDDESGDLESVLLQPVNSKAHDCFREAYNILGSFSFHCLNNAQSVSEEPPPGSASAPASTANRVPLDHVLRLNRDASEQLSRLLTCSCAGFPQLAMLYASIISQILVGYQQAAGCTQSAPWNSGDARLDPVSAPQRQSLTAFSPSASGVWPSTWSSTAASVLSAGGAKNTPTPTQPSEAVAPAKMVIGTFDIDDLRVQTALKIQLLTGEMRRAGQLIDQFALHTVDGQCMSDEYAFGGVHSLYQSLDAWLRSEHSRITNMMKAKLREFNS